MNAKPLLDFIARIESGGNYNAIYGRPYSQDDLSQYTVAEIQAKQRSHGKITGSSAFGRYQFLRGTLAHLIDVLGIKKTARFTPELQDKLATHLLMKQGASEWWGNAGNAEKDEEFMDSLAKVWASLPYHTGKSYYSGDKMGNKSLTTRAELLAVLHKMREDEPADSDIQTFEIVIRRQAVSAYTGYESPYVAIAIALLHAHGYPPGDGLQASITKYQQANGLVTDGICGPKTWKVLENV